MSIGTKQTFWRLPSDVRFWPKADIGRLLYGSSCFVMAPLSPQTYKLRVDLDFLLLGTDESRLAVGNTSRMWSAIILQKSCI